MLSILQFILYIILFLAGMAIMKKGLLHLSERKIKDVLHKFTNTPFLGMIFGIVVTILLQSSSAVMIITVGLIAVRVMTFTQSIGIILGTNIGTTATVEFLAYSTDEFIIPLLVLGSICIIFNNKKIRSLGLFVYGLGAIFLAMFGFEKLAVPLAENPHLSSIFVEMNEHSMFSVLVGIIITAIIQSSTAMTGIAMGFVHSGILGLPGAIGVMLGANIGTCVDTFIASIGGGKEARLSAYAHIWLNVLGVLVFLPFITHFSAWMEMLSTIPERQLAHASVLFNVIVSLLVLPFADKYARFIERIHG